MSRVQQTREGDLHLDIYTLRPVETKTEEHILPSFLGGKRTSPDLIDRTTNSEFGQGIEAGLHRALAPLLVLTDARSDRRPNDPPHRLQNVQGEDGQRYFLQAGGKPRPQPRLHFEEANGRTRIFGHAADESDVRRALRNKAKKRNWDLTKLTEMVMASGRRRREPAPAMTFDLALWDLPSYRATTKSLCNLLASHDPELFRSSGFDEIRRFVVEGFDASETWPVCVVDLDVSRHDPIGDLDHLLVVEGNDQGEVIGLAVYFSALAFVVPLGTQTDPDPFKRSYRVDQFGATDRTDDERDLRIAIPSVVRASRMTAEDMRSTAVSQLRTVMPRVQHVQLRTWQRAIEARFWATVVELAGNDEGSGLDEETLRPLVEDFADELVCGLDFHVRGAGVDPGHTKATLVDEIVRVLTQEERTKGPVPAV